MLFLGSYPDFYLHFKNRKLKATKMIKNFLKGEFTCAHFLQELSKLTFIK